MINASYNNHYTGHMKVGKEFFIADAAIPAKKANMLGIA